MEVDKEHGGVVAQNTVVVEDNVRELTDGLRHVERVAGSGAEQVDESFLPTWPM